jgi:hypothetical protein
MQYGTATKAVAKAAVAASVTSLPLLVIVA